eukprot:gb/GECG01011003.1/.p1 GENE.gb/GECG01011003.1/~~gb/GECG01011003.1/.p1  ORF type:complete len:565 (+),score=117.02 gb/GECG01011003.1/:1-1695(+)
MSAAVDSGHRRERFGHRRVGSGRQTTNRGFELVGRRSGVTLPTAVSKGDDGFDELSDYFDGDTSTITSATTTPMSKRSGQSTPDKSTFGNSFGERTGDSYRSAAPRGEKRVSFGEANSSTPPGNAASGGQAATPASSRRSSPGSKRSRQQRDAPQVTDSNDDDVSNAIAFEDYDEPPDEGGPQESESESDEANRTPPQRSVPTTTVQSVKKSPKKKTKSSFAASGKAASAATKKSKAAPKPKKQAQANIGGASSRRSHIQEEEAEAEANDSMEDDESEPLQRTPGGTDPKKIRKSLGVGVHSSEELKRAQEEEERKGIRRSKRRRWNPLKFWQSERLKYRREDPDDGFGDQLPVAERAEMLGIGSPDQEYKQSARKGLAKKQQQKRKKKDPQPVSPEESARHKPLPSSSLPKNIKFSDEADFHVQNDMGPDYTARAWGRYANLEFRELSQEGKSSGAASLDNPQFVSGILRLEPKGKKGKEASAGKCQMFFISQCQPKSIQLTIQNKHTLLSEGDTFFVPTYTEYNIINHSKEVPAEFFFVLLKDPSESQEDEGSDEDDEESDE